MALEIRKLQKEDEKLFLAFLDKFYHSEAVLHPTDRQLHLNIFNELMRGEEYLLCYVFRLDGEDVGYSLLSKSFCDTSTGILRNITLSGSGIPILPYSNSNSH